jgi:CelD/BcsL family acetyltransferase involved in cellulose biosynthesis
MTHRHGWRFSWLTTWDEIWDSSFVTMWQKWIASSSDAHVFFEPSMVRMWVRYSQTHERVEPRFAVAEHASGCKLLFPLVCVRFGWKNSWCRVLQPVGADRFDYHDPICCENGGGEVFSSFWSAFSEEAVRCFGQDSDQIIIPRVREFCAGSHRGFQEADRSPFIDLRDVASIDTVLVNSSKNLRQDVGRRVRRLEELGDLHLRVYGGSEVGLAKDALDGLIYAYCDRWGGDKKIAEFWKQMLSACLPMGFLHMSVLESNGAPISWHMGFLYKGRFYYYKPAYDVQLAAYSPGKVHLMKLIEQSLRQGATVFDFLRGEEAYKYDWTKSSISLYQMQIDGPTLRSQLARKARRLVCGSRRKVRELSQHFYHTS